MSIHELESSDHFPLSSTLRHSHLPPEGNGHHFVTRAKLEHQKNAMDISSIHVGGAEAGVGGAMTRVLGRNSPLRELEDSVETLTQSVTEFTLSESLTATLTESGTVTLSPSPNDTLTAITQNSTLSEGAARTPSNVAGHIRATPPVPDNAAAGIPGSPLDRNIHGSLPESGMKFESSNLSASLEMPKNASAIPASNTVLFDSKGASANGTIELFPTQAVLQQTRQQLQLPVGPSSVTYTLNLGPNLTLSPSHAVNKEDRGNQTSSELVQDGNPLGTASVKTVGVGQEAVHAPHSRLSTADSSVQTCNAHVQLTEESDGGVGGGGVGGECVGTEQTAAMSTGPDVSASTGPTVQNSTGSAHPLATRLTVSTPTGPAASMSVGPVPTPNGPIPMSTGPIPMTNGSIPISTASVPVATGSIPVSSESIPMTTGSIPVSTGSIPISVPIPTGSIAPALPSLNSAEVDIFQHSISSVVRSEVKAALQVSLGEITTKRYVLSNSSCYFRSSAQS